MTCFPPSENVLEWNKYLYPQEDRRWSVVISLLVCILILVLGIACVIVADRHRVIEVTTILNNVVRDVVQHYIPTTSDGLGIIVQQHEHVVHEVEVTQAGQVKMTP